MVSNGNVEGIAEPDEPGDFIRGIDIETASKMHRLISDNAHCSTIKPGKANNGVFRIMVMGLKYFSIIHDGLNNIPHVIHLVGSSGMMRVQGGVNTVRVIGRLN
jgi:hypothetical protein